MTDTLTPFAQMIWASKYQLKAADGTAIDADHFTTFARVARALAAAEPEKDRDIWAIAFYDAMASFEFLPAGRILAGAGSGRAVTLFNCYVMGTVPDSIDGIFGMLREAALTMQQGGGIGYDFSTIRPRGGFVKGVAADASGPLSFMDVWDAMCRTILSAGNRRGAMMATMRCDHPDILDFVRAKSDPARLRMFNLSVLVTDAFMVAVDADAPWRLHFENQAGETIAEKTLPARELWDAILRSTYDFAEPGVIFIDRINAANNLNYCETIAATNPCGEQPLPPYGACLLGSINLARLVIDPYTENARLNFDRLNALVPLAVRMLDNVVDISQFPLPQQKREAEAKRRIGLGVTGLADALLMMGVEYGTYQAVAFVDSIMRSIATQAYRASVGLAIKKGAFPCFDAEGFLAPGTFASTLPAKLQAKIRAHGVRNSHLLSIAPTGTISLFAGNVSGGIEPIFAAEYDRKVLQKDGSKKTETVRDYAVQVWQDTCAPVGSPPGLPPGYIDAQTLTPAAHVQMQAAAQKWVDSSISKTVNLPEDISFDDFKAVYRLGYILGCKGLATYRPNAVTGSVLSVPATPSAPPPAQSLCDPAPRPGTLTGQTYKVKWPGSEHAIYITINDIVADGRSRPFEVFINSKNMEHFAWTVALTRMISAVFRRGGAVGFVAEELKAVFDPRGGAWVAGAYVPSILAAIGGVIEAHLVATGVIARAGLAVEADPAAVETRVARMPPDRPPCPNCGSFKLRVASGCATCTDCGYSKCG